MTAQTQPAYTDLLDPEWIVAIQEEIDSRPETLADTVEPELLGRFDCEMGNPCDPTRYYAKLGEIEQYIIGFKDTEAILGDTLDYESDMADRDFWAKGAW